jgi:uncharacterized protein (DUF58 family)
MKPTLQTLRLALAFTALAVAALFWTQLMPLWQWGGIAALGLLFLDAFTLPRRHRLSATRSLPARFALGVPTSITLTLTHSLRRMLRLEVFDGIPASFEAKSLPLSLEIPAGQHAAVSYEGRFSQRGSQAFSPMQVLAGSMLGFWQCRLLIGEAQNVRVYPNYEPVVRFALLAMANRVEQMGIVRRRRIGTSLDFHQLRDYQDGDVLSRIDWKATSRRFSLVSRDFQEARHQTVLLVPDCGRRMRALDGGVSQFDHCLNAMLLISYIALRQGDEVGVAGFGGVSKWLPPVKGSHSMPKLLNHLYDYETTAEPSDFLEAAEMVMARQKRRALIIFLTNLRSEDGGSLSLAARLMQKRHLVLIATLREQELEARAAKPILSMDDALAYGALEHYFGERRGVLETLRSRRVLTVDETAQALPVALANRYLDVKAGGAL